MLNRKVIEGVEQLRDLIQDEIKEYLCKKGPVDIDVKLNCGEWVDHLKRVELIDGIVMIITDSGYNELFLYSLDEMIEIVDAL